MIMGNTDYDQVSAWNDRDPSPFRRLQPPTPQTVVGINNLAIDPEKAKIREIIREVKANQNSQIQGMVALSSQFFKG